MPSTSAEHAADSELGGVRIGSEDFAQDVANFLLGAVNLRGLDDRRHEVVLAGRPLGGYTDGVECNSNGGLVARRLHPPKIGELRLLHVVVDA
jgi:hypothetical protein